MDRKGGEKMKRNKLIIVMISIIAIGLFALPATFSYSNDMHTFKQIDPTNATTINAFCLKCHDDTINAQLIASDTGLYTNLDGTIHSSIGCQGCHQITGGAGGPGYNKGQVTTEHAARLPSCLECHSGTSGVIGVTKLMEIGDATHELMAPTEAHKNFNTTSDNDIQCIGCHTLTPVTGTVSASISSPPVDISGLRIG